VSSPNVKKVVLKRDYICISNSKIARDCSNMHTAQNVAGRKNMVKIVTDLITLLLE
jgi:hypothetical protein